MAASEAKYDDGEEVQVKIVITTASETKADDGKEEPEEEEVMKVIGKSWFEADEEHRQTNGRLSLTRILFACLVSDGNSFDVSSDVPGASRLHDFFQSFGADKGRYPAGGIVLLSNDREVTAPTCALGFLEMQSPTDAEDCMGRLPDLEHLGLHSIRIFLVSDDCPYHDFAPFGVYFGSPPSEDTVDIENDDPTEIFRDLMVNLCKHSLSLSESEAHPRCGHLKILKGDQRKSMPSAKRITLLVGDRSQYPSLEDYLDIFHSPIDLQLESEKASPLLPVIDWDGVKNIVDEAENC